MDEYSEILGMTPRQHEARMRKWYVLLAIALFFSVFGEGFFMLSARRKEKREAEAAASRALPAAALPATPVAPTAGATEPPPEGAVRR